MSDSRWSGQSIGTLLHYFAAPTSREHASSNLNANIPKNMRVARRSASRFHVDLTERHLVQHVGGLVTQQRWCLVPRPLDRLPEPSAPSPTARSAHLGPRCLMSIRLRRSALSRAPVWSRRSSCPPGCSYQHRVLRRLLPSGLQVTPSAPRNVSPRWVRFASVVSACHLPSRGSRRRESRASGRGAG